MDRSQLCLGCMRNSEGAAVCPHCGWRLDSKADSPLYLPAGTVLRDQYVVGRTLSYADSWVTYLAWDRGLSRKVELKEFFPEGIAERLPDAGVVPRNGKEQAYRQNLEAFLQRTLEPAQQDFFRANGSAYLVMESVKEVTVESPSGGDRPSSKNASWFIERPSTQPEVVSKEASSPAAAEPAVQTAGLHSISEASQQSQPAVPPSRPWLKWAAAFFALMLAGGVAYEQHERREREAQEERARQREIDVTREREAQKQRELAAQQEWERQQQLEREREEQRERELRQQQSILEAHERELQQKKLERKKAPVPPPKPAPRYDQLLARAQEALRQSSPKSVQLAEQVIDAYPSKPGGYEVLGYAKLYFRGDARGAETAMRAAMARGGAAVFRLKHDHGNGGFQSFCAGVLMIRHSGISYAAPNISHRVDVTLGQILAASRNKRSFLIRTSARSYNFGPTSSQPEAEVALAVRLMGK